MQLVRKFFGQFDMFAAPPTLRAKEQDKTSSLCSGVISLLLALFFSYVFIFNVIGVVTYTKIDSVQTQSRLEFDEADAQNVFFSIRVGYLPIQIANKYFEVGFFIVAEDGTNTTYPMQQCTSDQWSRLGDNYLNQFNKFHLQDFFCQRPEQQIELKKVYYAPNSQYAVVYVKPCQTNNSLTCENQASQISFIQNLNNIQGAIFISIYFLDKAINPNSKQPINYFTNTDAEFAFTPKRGIIATIQLGSFTVKTDMSVFPVEDIQIEQGNFLHSFRQTSIQIKSHSDNFAMIYLTMNRKHIQVQRKVGKLDDMLSYAGGLFSIIIGFLAIFFASFNKYRYELMVAQGIFHQDDDGNAIKQYDFSFFLYIKYTLFDWISILFCFQPKWEDCRIVQKTRDEANKQMDVTRLFRKIQGLQIAVNHIMINKNERDCLSLLKPQPLTRIIRNRLVLQYYQTIIQGKNSLTFSEYRISRQILNFALTLCKNENKHSGSKIQNLDVTEQDLHHEQIQIDYQSLYDIDYMLEVIQAKFKRIAQQADQIKLLEQQKEIQIQLSLGFFDLQKEVRMDLMQRVPIKILYRLAKCYNSQKKSQQTSNSSYNKKKVKLNIIGSAKVHDFSHLNDSACNNMM